MPELVSAPQTETQPSEPATPPLSPEEQRKRKWMQVGFIALAVVIVVIVVGLSVLAIQPQNEDTTRRVRDLAIIFLAILSVGTSLLMIILLWQVTLLTLMMRDEIKPLLESINETMNTVRGTAVFMSDNLVQPTIKAASAFAGVRRVFESLAGIQSSVKPKQRKE